MPVSVNKLPSVIDAWQALYKHFKSAHAYSLSILSEVIILLLLLHLLLDVFNDLPSMT